MCSKILIGTALLSFILTLGTLAGGMMSLLMQGRPIFESAHLTTGLIGMGLLTVQAIIVSRASICLRCKVALFKILLDYKVCSSHTVAE